jgi:hypothetical protein
MNSRRAISVALDGPIRFTPNAAEQQYVFEGSVDLGPLFRGVAAVADNLASPTRNTPDVIFRVGGPLIA